MAIDPSPRLGFFTRMASFITGTDPEILQRSPIRDQSSVATIALLIVGICAWQTLSFALTAHMLLDEAQRIRPELVAIAALMACIVAMVDSYGCIRSAYFLKGMEQLKRGGAVLPGYYMAKLRNSVLLSVRLVIAGIFSVAGAIGFNLYCATPEINRELAQQVVRDNAPLIEKITTAYDTETARLERERETLQASLTAARADAGAYRLDALKALPEDPELKIALEQERRSQLSYREAERRLARVAAGDANGRQMALQRVGARRAEWQGAQARTARLRAQVEEARVQRRNAVQASLTETQSAGQLYQARLDALDKAYAARIAAREDSIRTAVERDPAYQASDRGMLARVKVLAQLMADPSVFAMVVVLHCAFLVIELGAVLCKALTNIPSFYAVILASEEHAHEIEVAQDLLRRIEDDGVPDAGDFTPGIDPQPPGPTPANDAAVPPQRADDDTEEDAAEDTLDRMERGAQLAQEAARAKAKPKCGKPPANGTSTLAGSILDGPVRRGRGRPPGTRNRPKPANDDRPAGDGTEVA